MSFFILHNKFFIHYKVNCRLQPPHGGGGAKRAAPVTCNRGRDIILETIPKNHLDQLLLLKHCKWSVTVRAVVMLSCEVLRVAEELMFVVMLSHVVLSYQNKDSIYTVLLFLLRLISFLSHCKWLLKKI